MLIGMRKFFSREDGLVTVEWVALAAAVVVGGIAVVWTVMDHMGSVANKVGSSIEPLALSDQSKSITPTP